MHKKIAYKCDYKHVFIHIFMHFFFMRFMVGNYSNKYVTALQC